LPGGHDRPVRADPHVRQALPPLDKPSELPHVPFLIASLPVGDDKGSRGTKTGNRVLNVDACGAAYPTSRVVSLAPPFLETGMLCA
jgi:hypothetical protein